MNTIASATCRILVVEDETLIAVLIEDVLTAMGHEIVGPIGKLEAAKEAAREANFDAAILDVTIRGGDIYPVAEMLAAQNIPFVFASGYGEWALPQALKDRPRLSKPFATSQLEEQVRLLCREVALRRQ